MDFFLNNFGLLYINKKWDYAKDQRSYGSHDLSAEIKQARRALVINWDPEGPWSGLQVLIYSYRFRFTKDAILINIMLAWSI